MNKFFRIALWNANGLTQRRQELALFADTNKIDIMLISETHFTHKNYLNIRGYNIYDTKHPDGTAHGGTAIIIRKNVKHHELTKYEKEHLQATSIEIEEWNGPLVLSSVYCPPKHTIKSNEFDEYLRTLGPRFIAGGDYNAKHKQWGSRLNTTRGRQLQDTIKTNKYNTASSGEPTYWPTDSNKIPDVLDFFITNGIGKTYINVESSLELSSDHTPVIMTISTALIHKTTNPTLHNKKTDWNAFSKIMNERINLNMPLKNEIDIDDANEHLVTVIQETAWETTPKPDNKQQINDYPMDIKNNITIKRRLRRKWQLSRDPIDKKNLNKATKKLKKLIYDYNNNNIQNNLKNLTATQATEYSLWKITKKLKRPPTQIPPIKKADNQWAKSDNERAETFAEHLASVFTSWPAIQSPSDHENMIAEFLESPLPMSLPINNFSFTEVQKAIKYKINTKKSPGYDLITGKILNELPKKAIVFLTALFNSVLRTSHIPNQWKVAQIIMIPKPGKPPTEVSSYRPISLLPIISKLFEKLLLSRMNPHIAQEELIPEHQFGFRNSHSTIEQVNRVYDIIRNSLENKKYCSAVFLDIQQAFDKVWHNGLLFKIKSKLPQFYLIIKSYLNARKFQVRFGQELSALQPINAGVPQGSVLGPLLYTLYTADLPTTEDVTVATYADDTAILAADENPSIASRSVQEAVTRVETWLTKWRIRASETKSVHITFTLRKSSCPPVTLNNQVIPSTDVVKYLGLHLDRRLTWSHHIKTKRKQLDIKVKKLYWLIGRHSQLSTENKLLIYKAIIKPVWTYGIQLWGTASKSNINILQRLQSKILRTIINAPWYVSNKTIHTDLEMDLISKVIQQFSGKYQTRLKNHPNQLARGLMNRLGETSRLKRPRPQDLINRFHS